jgi:hypothetical protein
LPKALQLAAVSLPKALQPRQRVPVLRHLPAACTDDALRLAAA